MGMDALLLASPAELTQALKDHPVNGILLELTTLVTASQHDKQAAQDVVEFFPNAKFKVADNEVRVLSHSFEHFVAECQRFKARPLRRHERKERVLAVYLSTDATFDRAEKTVTANISEGGCFIFSPHEWKIGDRVWLRFPENNVALSGVVRTWHEWGNNRIIPGIGIQLDEMLKPTFVQSSDEAV
jgi:hypothetical protein